MDSCGVLDAGTISGGKEFLKDNALVIRRKEQQGDTSVLICAKAWDIFNYVDHPWVRLDASGDQLLEYGCDCPDSRDSVGACRHIAALLLSLNGGTAR